MHRMFAVPYSDDMQSVSILSVPFVGGAIICRRWFLTANPTPCPLVSLPKEGEMLFFHKATVGKSHFLE